MPHRVFLPNWVWNVALASVVVASWLSTDSLWLFLGLVAALFVQGLYVFHFVRCPVCHGSLTFHQAFIPHTTRYRFQLACSRCEIIWDTGKISDDSD
jgi:hypothetical protein